MEDAISLNGVQAYWGAASAPAERDPHPHLYDMLNITLDHFGAAAEAGELYVRIELAVLDISASDWTSCNAPPPARAMNSIMSRRNRDAPVCRDAGLPYADRLFRLPEFLKAQSKLAADRDGLIEAFRMTQFFLHRHVYEPRGLEPSRRVTVSCSRCSPSCRGFFRTMTPPRKAAPHVSEVRRSCRRPAW